jgi:hypothetical protein
VRVTASGDPQRAFLAWSFGAGLFAHAATCVSVSYFDQSVLFLYLTLAAAATLKAGLLHKQIMTEEAIEASGALETSLVQKASVQ